MGMWGLGMAAWCFRMRKTYPALMFTALHAIAQAKGALALGLGYGKDTSIDSDRDLSTQPLIVVRIQGSERSRVLMDPYRLHHGKVVSRLVISREVNSIIYMYTTSRSQ